MYRYVFNKNPLVYHLTGHPFPEKCFAVEPGPACCLQLGAELGQLGHAEPNLDILHLLA